MNPRKILLADDDVKILKAVNGYLTRKGFILMAVDCGRKVLDNFLGFQPDLVILDITMPDIDGFEVCRKIRETNDVPVIFISAKGDINDKILGFTLGSDDYLTKPFFNDELLLRIKAILKRIEKGTAAAQNVITISDFIIDRAARSVAKGGRRLELTLKEFNLLWLLAANRDQVLTRELLIQHIWETDYNEDQGVLNALIKRLREKVEDDPANPCYIKTVRGVGYRFNQIRENR